MSGFPYVLQIFLLVQLCIMTGYLSNKILLALWRKKRGTTSCKQLVRVSQFLLVLSILLPILIPARTVPQPLYSSSFEKPLSDSIDGLKLKLGKKLVTESNRSPSPAPSQPRSWLSVVENTSLAQIFFITLLFLIGVGYVRLFKNLFLLNKLLKTSYRLRQIHKLTIGVSEKITVPFSTWFFGTRWILIPQDILTDKNKFALCLAHEMEHQRAKDTFWAFLVALISPLFGLNPFFSKWKEMVSELQEFSCDEVLIGRRKLSVRKYADCLLHVAEAALRSRLQLVAVAGMANNPLNIKTSLERRIRMFSSYRKHRPKSYLLGVFTLMSALSISAVGFSFKSAQVDKMGGDVPNPGVAVLDPHVQEVTQNILANAVREYIATSGFAIVSEAKTGRLLAVANVDIEPSMPHSPHWALGLRLEPASVMKAVIAAAAIEKGATFYDEVHNCEKGTLLVEDKEYGDWKAFDKLTTAETVIQSSNICGIKIARKLGAKNIGTTLKDFGFGPEGVTSEFPEARPGVLPSITEVGEQHYVAQVSSGYRHFSTPLEIVQAFGAIANGGNLLKPVQANVGANIPPTILKRVLSEKTSEEMRKMLLGVMSGAEGTARLEQSKKYKLGGKTGTGHSPWLADESTILKRSQIAHFVGFGPVEAPELVVYVGIQDPKNEKGQKAHGSSHAAPVFREIMDKLLDERKK